MAVLIPVSIGMVVPAAAQQRSQYDNTPSHYPQPTDRDALIAAAADLNTRRSEAIRKRDMKGITAVYTANAAYIELLPRLILMKGRAQIQQHFQQLFDARASDLTTTVTTADMAGTDSAMVGGDYYLITDDKRIAGHFVQTLRREEGTWKIASHVFARPEPVTTSEFNDFRGN